jgi:arsenate reductase
VAGLDARQGAAPADFGWPVPVIPETLSHNRGARRNHPETCMTVTIYHNPDCQTSKATLDAIEAAGEKPEIIEYLKTPPSRETLIELLDVMGLKPRDLLRKKGTPYAELGLDDPALDDEEILDQMIEHPILINRPIVVTEKGVRLCQSPDDVKAIL